LSATVRVENGVVYRVHDPSRLGTVEMGDLKSGVSLAPRDSLEFLLRVGAPGDSGPSTEIDPRGCTATCTGLTSEGSPIMEFVRRDPRLRIKVHSTAGPGTRLRKWLAIENSGRKPVVLFDVVLERVSVPAGVQLSGGGRGWPVFIKGIGFAAVEFPESESVVSKSQYSLEYYPAVTVQPGEAYESELAIFEFASGDPEMGFRRYVDEIRLRKSGAFFASYGSWGAHEYEGPNESIINLQLDHLIDLKTNWHIPFEYFVLDFGYWPEGAGPWESGDFSQIDEEKRFPNGAFDDTVRRMSESGTKLGMWFGIGCPGRKAFVSNLQKSFLELNAKYGLKLVKIGLADWDCEDPAHDHLPGRYMRWQAARNMMDVFAALKTADPEAVIYAASFTRSPWWLKHVDFIAKGGPEPSDVPAPSLGDSQILQADLEHRFFELDSGTHISYSDSHFWTGKQGWRKNAVMSLSRSDQLSLSGELQLLNDDDKLFLQRVVHMRKVHASSFTGARHILGDPCRTEAYGYANTANGRGLVAVFNPSWEARSLEVKAEDLGCDPSVRNVCVELFPDTEVAAIPAAGGHFHEHIDPWEVLWLEVGPSEEHCELLESKSIESTNCFMPVTPVSPSEDMVSSLSMPLERMYYHTGTSFRCRPVIPRDWEGFPLVIDLQGLKGELYINNRPFSLRDGSEFALLYPWTPPYGLVKFGRENLIYVATKDTRVAPENDMLVSAVPYFSSSACREDWPHPGDASMVVTIRYMQDGRPIRPSLDPRIAQCAAWLDGTMMKLYRVPPIVPRIRSGFSWAVFMLDLESDWECVRIIAPRLAECDCDVQFFLTNRVTAAAYAKGE